MLLIAICLPSAMCVLKPSPMCNSLYILRPLICKYLQYSINWISNIIHIFKESYICDCEQKTYEMWLFLTQICTCVFTIFFDNFKIYCYCFFFYITYLFKEIFDYQNFNPSLWFLNKTAFYIFFCMFLILYSINIFFYYNQ